MTGSVDIKVRPLRLAYLVDANSKEQVRGAMMLASTLWGGTYSPIITLYKNPPKHWQVKPFKTPSVKEVVLGYIDSFDPDVLVQMSSDMPQYVKDTGIKIIKPNEIWENHGHYDNPFSPNFGIGIFDLLNDIFEKNFRYRARYPVKVVIPKIPDTNSLLWTSIFGEFPKKIIDKLKTGYFEPLGIKEPDIEAGKVGNLLAGNILYPLRSTKGSLTRSGRRRIRGDGVVFYFDGSKMADIVDFWNLRATGFSVFPMPKQLVGDQSHKGRMIEFLKMNRRHWRHQPSVCDVASLIKGRTVLDKDWQDFAGTINLVPPPDDSSRDGYFLMQGWYPRIWDSVAKGYDEAEPVDNYEQKSSIEVDAENFKAHFKPIFPTFATDTRFGSEPRCVNEISFRLYGTSEHMAEVLPRSSGKEFIRSISGKTSFGDEWRSSRKGLVHLVKDTTTEYWDVPTAENVFFAWLSDNGWTASLSNPGKLARQIYKKMEGNILVLGNQKLLEVLDHMNGGKNLDGKVGKNELPEGRDLSEVSLKKELASDNEHFKDNLYNYLISRGVFKVGLKVECPDCSRKSWYPTEEIKESFICPKCLNTFPAVGNVGRSSWSYKTVGPLSVSQHADGSLAVLLSVNLFNSHITSGINFAPVYSFTAKDKNDKVLEADFAGFWQESSARLNDLTGVIFGECKTYGKFEKKDFDRMSFIAKTFPGCVIAFCTLKEKLMREEVRMLKKIAKKGRKKWKGGERINPVLILTGKELLSWKGIPYCWDGEHNDKFRDSQGILGACDATQQIYLGLPSWAEEDEKEYEKRRKNRAKRRGANTP